MTKEMDKMIKFDLQLFGDTVFSATSAAEKVNIATVGSGSNQVKTQVGTATEKTVTLTSASGTIASVNAGAGNDSITVGAGVSYVAITAGRGNDYVTIDSDSGGNTFVYANGDGHDTIEGWDASQSFKITGVSSLDANYLTKYASMSADGKDMILKIGSGSVTFKGVGQAAQTQFETIEVYNGDDSGNNPLTLNIPKMMQGTAKSEVINNNTSEDDIKIMSGTSATTPYKLFGAAGNDTIYNAGSYVSISGGDGSDKIILSRSDTKLTKNVSIYGGKGNDTIDLSADTDETVALSGHVIEFNSGDGKDVIIGYNSSDTIKFGADITTIKSAVVDNQGNFVITTNNGTITLKEAEGGDKLGGTKITLLKSDGTTNWSDALVTAANTNSSIQVTKDNDGGYITIQKRLTRTSSSEYINVGNAYEDYVIDAGAGNDTINVDSAPGVSILGGNGNDRIILSGGNGIQNTVANSTTYVMTETGIIAVVAGAGNDYIDATADSGTVYVATGISAGHSNTTVGAAHVYVFDKNDGKNTIVGFNANDTIYLKEITEADTATVISNAGFDSTGKNYQIKYGNTTIVLAGYKGGQHLNVASETSGGLIAIGDEGDKTLVTKNGETNASPVTWRIVPRILQGTAKADLDLTLAGTDHDSFGVNALGGNDKIYIRGTSHASVNAGDGNDTIYITSDTTTGTGVNGFGEAVTIVGGKGNDVIYGEYIESDTGVQNAPKDSLADPSAQGRVYEFNVDSGNDTIYFYGPNDSISLKDDATIQGSTIKGQDVILKINKSGDSKYATITLKDYITSEQIYDMPLHVTSTTVVSAYVDDGGYVIPKELYGTTGNDKNAGGTNALLHNTIGGFKVDGLAGNDIISNTAAIDVSLIGGAGNDTIITSGSNGVIDGGTGNDHVTLTAEAFGNTVSVGAGKDTIHNNAELGGNTFQFGQNDGTNYIYGFGEGNAFTFVATDSAYSDLSTVKVTRTDEGQVITYDKTKIILKNTDGTKDIEGGIDFDLMIKYGEESHTTDASTAKMILGTNANDTKLENLANNYTDKIAGSDNYTIDARGGNDTIINDGSFVSINGGAGNDRISLVAEADSNSGRGIATNNTIYGGKGNDIIFGNTGGGHIYVYEKGDGNDTIYGFNAEADSISVEGSAYDSAELTANGYLIKVGSGSILVKGALKESTPVGSTTLSDYEDLAGGTTLYIRTNDATRSDVTVDKLVPGTNVGDVLTNSLENYQIKGYGGNDTITNNAGGDSVLIDAGAGNDKVTLEGGADVTVVSGLGNDLITVKDQQKHTFTFSAGDGVNTIRGITNGDVILIDDNQSVKSAEFVGSQENDGKDQYYVLTLSDNRTKIYLQGSSDTTNFDTKTLKGVEFTVSNTATITPFVVPDEVQVEGTEPNYLASVAASSESAPTLEANPGAIVKGDAKGNTIINTGVNDLYIDGGRGNDTIKIDSGDNNTISGGAGNDYISTTGVQVIEYTRNDGNDTIEGWNSLNTLYIHDATDTQITTMVSAGGDFVIKVGTGTITFKDPGIDTTIKAILDDGSESHSTYVVPRLIQGTSGNDTGDNKALKNDSEDAERYTILAYAGNDSIYNTGDDVLIDAGAGNDTISNFSTTNVTITAGAGNDVIHHLGENSTIQAGDGNDIVHIYTNSSNNFIEGGKGNDTIFGNNPAEGEGNTYFYTAGDGNDVIVGFNPLADIIQITDTATTHLTAPTGEVTEAGYVIKLSNGNTLTLRGVKADGKEGTSVNDFSPLAGDSKILLKINDTSYSDTLKLPMQMNVIKGTPFVNTDQDEKYTIQGTGYDDTIFNNAASNTIIADAGNDIIVNEASYVSIVGGDGHDSIYMAPGPNDTPYSEVSIAATNVTIDAGKGNDVVYLNSEEHEENEGHLYKYVVNSDGKDTIYGFTSKDTIDLENYTQVNENSFEIINTQDGDGNDDPEHKDIVMKVGNGSITFKALEVGTTINFTGSGIDAYTVTKVHALTKTEGIGSETDEVFINSTEGYYIKGKTTKDFITNYAKDSTIIGGAGYDVIYNIYNSTIAVVPSGVSIEAGTGNDSVTNEGKGSYINLGEGKNFVENRNPKVDGDAVDESNAVSIVAGSDNDTIKNYSYGASITAGDGANWIYNGNSEVAAYETFIESGKGNDTVISYGDAVSIKTGEGADSIRIYTGTDVIVEAGKGNDKIIASTDASVEQATYIYNLGTDANSSDGHDVIYNFRTGSAIQLEGYSTATHLISTEQTKDAYKITFTNSETKAQLGSISFRRMLGDGNNTTDTLLEGGVAIKLQTGSGTYLKEIETYETPYIKVGKTTSETYVNNDADYTISLLGGQDTITNNADNVSIVAGKDSDIIYNTGTTVSILGGGGSDSIYIGSASNTLLDVADITINGGAGDDLITAKQNHTKGIVYEYATGDGNDTIVGFTNADTIKISGSYTYTLKGGPNADSNTFLINVGSGNNAGSINLGTLAQGSEVHIVDASKIDEDGNYEEGVKIRVPRILNVTARTATVNTTDDMIINGTTSNDTITNNADNVVIYGNAGADQITLTADNEGIEINAGAGNDTITAHESHGNGVLYKIGNADGNDLIINFSANDSIQFTAGTYNSSLVSINPPSNTGNENAFNDVVIANGSTRITLQGVGDPGTILHISDSLNAHEYEVPKYIAGTAGTDTLVADDSGYFIDARAGNDTIVTEYAYTTISGGAGADYIEVLGNHADYASVMGDAGADNIYIRSKYAYVDGGADADKITIEAGAKSATIAVGAGNDTIYNHDSDANTTGHVYEFTTGNGTNNIFGYTTKDTIKITGHASLLGAVTADNFASVKGYDTLYGSGYGDLTLKIGNTNVVLKGVEEGKGVVNVADSDGKLILTVKTPEKWIGNAGTDSMVAHAGSEQNQYDGYYILPLGGNDTVENYASDVTIDGGAGNDYIINQNTASSTSIFGGAGDDTIINAAQGVSIYAGAGNDYIKNASDSGVVYIFGNSDGQNTIEGFDGTNDTIRFLAGSKPTAATLSTDRKTYTFSVGSTTVNLKKKNDATWSFSDNAIAALEFGAFGATVSSSSKLTDPTVWVGDSTATLFNATAAGANGLVILTGDGSDTVTNSAANVRIYATVQGNASVDNFNYINNTANTSDASAVAVSIYGGAGSDTVINGANAWRTYINTGAGNDVVYNSGTKVNILVGAGDDVIYNDGAAANAAMGSSSTLRVTINADAGNDSITNSANFTYIQAGAGNDTVVNSGASLSVYGGAGADVISNTSVAVRIFGEADDDTIYNFGASASEVVVNAAAGDDYIYNEANKVSIDAGAGNDYIEHAGSTGANSTTAVSIVAGAGNDTIKLTGGNAGYVSIYAGAGEDVIDAADVPYANRAKGGINYVFGTNDGVNVIEGYNKDSDTIRFTVANQKITSASISGDRTVYSFNVGNTVIKLVGNEGAWDNPEQSVIIYSAAANANSETVLKGSSTGISPSGNYMGSDNNETFTISSNMTKAVVYTGAGNDTANVYAESAKIVATISSNTINNNTINNYATSDRLANAVSIWGGAGNDTIFNGVNAQYTYLNAGDGDNEVTNNAEHISIGAGSGSDTIINTMKLVTINAGAGDNVISNTAAVDTFANRVIIIAGAGNDSVLNTSALGTINVAAGNDTIFNYGNAVSIDAGNGDDVVNNYGSSTRIVTGAGSDTIINYAGDGANAYQGQYVTIDAGAADDFINNQAEHVSISAGDGKDTVTNIAQYVTITAAGNSNKITNSGSPEVRISLTGNAASAALANTVDNSGNAAYIWGSSGYDSIENSGTTVSIIANGGNDTITNRGAAAVISLVSGNNYVYNIKVAGVAPTGFASDTSIYGGSGVDYIVNSEATKVYISGAKGNDSIVNYNGTYVSIEGGADNDTIVNYAGGSNASILGGDGGDRIYNSGTSVFIDAGVGANFIYNYSNTVTINAGTGNDTIYNYGGNITIDADNGTNYIYNYSDTVKITTVAGTDNIITSGKNVTIDAGAGNDRITLNDNASSTSVFGGAGADIISLSSSASHNTIYGGAGNDIIYSNNQTNYFYYSSETAVSSNQDVINGFDKANNTFILGAGITLVSETYVTNSNKHYLHFYTGTSGSYNEIARIDLGTSVSQDDTIKINGNVANVANVHDYKFIITQGTVSNGRTAEAPITPLDDLFEDNNFISNDAQISDITGITQDNYSAGNIETLNLENLAQGGGYVPTATYGTEKKQE